MKQRKYCLAKYWALLLIFCGLAIPAYAGSGIWTDITGIHGGINTLSVDGSGGLYAGTDAHVYMRASGSNSWADANSGLTDPALTFLLAGRDGTAYASTHSGIFKRGKGSSAWVAASIGLTNPTVMTLAMDGNGILYAGTAGGGVFKSIDGAGHWTQLGALGSAAVTALSVGTGGVLYAGTDGDGIFKSSNGGASWTAINSGLTTSKIRALLIDASGALYAGGDGTGMLQNIGSGAFSPLMLGPSTPGLFKTTDGGASWKVVSGNFINVGSLAMDAGGTLYARSDGSIFKTNDGGQTWSSIITNSYSQLAVDATGALYAGTAKGDVLKYVGSSNTLTEVSSTYFGYNVDQFFSPLLLDKTGALYIGTYLGGVFKSTRGGYDWVKMNNGLGNLSVYALTADAGGGLYAGTNAGVFKSANGGITWAALAGLEKFNIKLLFVDASGAVYAVAYGGAYGAGFFKSVQGGAWTDVHNNLSNPYVYAMSSDPGGAVYVGTPDGVSKSSNGGASWLPMNNGLGNTAVFALARDVGGNLYAGTHSGIFKTSNGGLSWSAFNTGLAGLTVNTLVADAQGTIYAGTDTGVFKLTNGNNSWQALNDGLPKHSGLNGISNIFINSLATDAVGTLFAVNADGAYQYTPSTKASLTPRLVNVSSRANTLTGDSVAIAGFIVTGGNKTVLITARGPSLTAAGVPNILANPRLRLIDSSGKSLASNDDWGSNGNAQDITATQGAPSDSKESAILVTLAPGAYTAIMDGVGSGTGNGLLAVDGVSNPSDGGMLVNLSTRAMVGAGDNVLIAGFIVTDGPRKVLLTARGASLAAAGVAGALADPMIELHDASGALIDQNDDASGATNYADILASGKAPGEAHESAILRTLAPGAYTLVVRSKSASQGVGLVAVDLVD